MNYRVLLATSILLATTYTSIAQEVDDYTIRRSVLTKNDIRTDDIDGNKMVINAGRSDKSVDRLPVTVYVVTHDEIMANGYVTLCDVLKPSDGVLDQFGGPSKSKFMKKNFKKMLMEINGKKMEEQKTLLDNTITSWIGTNYFQMDDMVVIGIQI